MIASVAVQSPEYEDPNFTPIFMRKRKENYLTLSNSAIRESKSVYIKPNHLVVVTNVIIRRFIRQKGPYFLEKHCLSEIYA